MTRRNDSSSFDDDGPDWEDPESRTLFLMGEIRESLVRDVIEGIFRLSEYDALSPIYLIVSTYGGSVDDTFALYDAIRLSGASIRTVGLGKIMSAGVLILAAGQKGHRLMGRNARLMMHGGFELNGGDVFTQDNNLLEFKRAEKQFDSLLAKECKKSLAQVEKLYLPSRLDKYMTAQECLKFSLVDKIV